MLFVEFVPICILDCLEGLGRSCILQKDVPARDRSLFLTSNSASMEITEIKQRARHIPFGRTVSLWVELSGDLAKLGENLVYDVLEFVQSLWAHLRDVVHHHH